MTFGDQWGRCVQIQTDDWPESNREDWAIGGEMISGMRPRRIKGGESRRRRKKIVRKKEAPYS
jgi:hypothetical protein